MKKLLAASCLDHFFKGIIILIFIWPVTTLKAQILTAPWGFDNQIQFPVVSNINAVNCDMVQCPNYSNPFSTYQNITAVVWDNDPGTGWATRLSVIYSGHGGLPLEIIPNANFPDVVIGDDINNPGHVYIIAVIYRDLGVATNDIRIKTYKLDLSVTPYALSPQSSVLISNGMSGCEIPHIDLFTNVGSLVGTSPNQVPMLNEYVATWNYNDPSIPQFEVKGAIGNINTLTPSQTFSVCTTGRAPDVAAYTDGNGDKYAAFVYGGNPPEVAEFDLTTSPPSLVGSAYPFTGLTRDYGCRIEAMSQYNSSNAKWVAVASDNGRPEHIVVKNDLLSSPFNYKASSGLASVLPPKTTSPYKMPVIAAGVGGYGVSNLIGNFQYTAGWYDAAGINLYSQDVDAATGLPDNSGNYWKINNSAMTSTGSIRASCMAMSSSSNSGWGLLSAWSDGTNIRFKTTSRNPNSYYFKTTNIDEQEYTELSVHPNPAKDALHVTNAAGASYRISDMTGRIVKVGVIDKDGSVEITTILPGLYHLEVSIAGQQNITMFSKE